MSSLSTHVLDAALGVPAAGVAVSLEDSEGTTLGTGITDEDGRASDLVAQPLAAGAYRLRFATGAYHAATGQDGFYPEVIVTFTVTPDRPHHHVPLLLAPYAYSTYRGS
jgi:5-hydroxyisourate hydrolase